MKTQTTTDNDRQTAKAQSTPAMYLLERCTLIRCIAPWRYIGGWTLTKYGPRVRKREWGQVSFWPMMREDGTRDDKSKGNKGKGKEGNEPPQIDQIGQIDQIPKREGSKLTGKGKGREGGETGTCITAGATDVLSI